MHRKNTGLLEGKKKPNRSKTELCQYLFPRQEEDLKMMESGQIGWVEREVQARQWADQVGEDVGVGVGVDVGVGVVGVSVSVCLGVGVGVGVDQVCPGEEGGAE